jgi:hypothetical protein
MNILNKKNIIFLIIIIFVFGIFSFSHAQGLKDAFKREGDLDTVAKSGGIKTSAGVDTANIFIGAVIKSIISVIGVLFLIMMIYGGFLWMTAGGNESQVEKAKKLIIATVIGTIIVVGAYAISYFVIHALSEAALTDSSGS